MNFDIYVGRKKILPPGASLMEASWQYHVALKTEKGFVYAGKSDRLGHHRACFSKLRTEGWFKEKRFLLAGMIGRGIEDGNSLEVNVINCESSIDGLPGTEGLSQVPENLMEYFEGEEFPALISNVVREVRESY